METVMEAFSNQPAYGLLKHLMNNV
jgi:hypothetical protein